MTLSLAMLLSSLGTNIANVALPALAQAFTATFESVQWIVLAYLLAITTLIVSAGRLGDIIGPRRLLLSGMSLFTLASVLCGGAPSLWILVAARALQGLGAAIMMALTIAFVAKTIPKEKTGRAMGLLGTMSAVGTALGPSLGGVLISSFGWRAIFLACVPLCVLTLLLAYRFLPADSDEIPSDRAAFDVLGTGLLALTIASYALAMTIGRGSFHMLNVSLLFGALVSGGLFALAESKAESPLIRLSMLKGTVLRTGFVMSILVTSVVMATLVIGPFYLAGALRLDAAHVGFVMSSGPIVAALTSAPGGRIVDRFGASVATIAGLLGMVAGCTGIAVAPMRVGIAGCVAPLVVITAGYSLFQAANNTAVMTSIRPDEVGVISGLLGLSRNLGLITGVTVMGAVFARATGAINVVTAYPAAIATGMRVTFAFGALLILLALVIAYLLHRGIPQGNLAMRVRVLFFAPLLAVALPTPSSAQAFGRARVAASVPTTRRATTLATASSVGPAIPRTPAGAALRAWIAAFNSADSARVAAYARRFETDVVVSDEIGFREQTGGFELLSIERSGRRHLEFIVRERKSPMTAYGVIDVSAAAPHRVTARRFQPLGPNVTAAALRLDAATRARTVAAAAAILDTFYVSPDVATRVGETLRVRSARGAYRLFGNGVSFAMRLDDDLAALTHDKHLHLMFSVDVLPRESHMSAVRSVEDAAREQARLDGIKCGFDKVEVRSGNVGYIKLDMFADLEFCGAAASAAMTVVAGTGALILDLRDNGGGEPTTVSYIASYLFDRRTHLNDLWTRRTGTTEEFWTRDSVPGLRFGGAKPVYVLTSSRTFSGGEEFAYDLQQLKRATVIGETTGGGAHPMASHRIDDHFLMAVPFARPVNPVTKTNWEGGGVVPDVKVPAADALTTALRRVGRAP